MPDIKALEKLRSHFNTGVTRPYAFRKEQLKKLRKAILDHEQELYQAYFSDLKKNAEEGWVTETGMVIAELNTAIRHFRRWMAPQKAATNLLNFPSYSKVISEPLGVVLIISPWNYPFQLLINPLVGAIAAGNCVVIKPSEFAPATAAVIKKMILSSFPEDYILFAEGDGANVIPAMMNGFRFDHVFYTGSTAVGRVVYKMAAEQLVPVTLELGGKSPCIVENDANIKVAARRIAMTKFSNAGQMCVAPDFILVRNAVKENFIDEMKLNIRKFFGDKPEEDYGYGKIINEKQFDRLSAYLDQGKIISGGRAIKEKLFIEPTLVTDIRPGAAIMKDEIFGPILPIIGFDTEAEALSVIQQSPNPLAFYVYTSSKQKENYWLENVPSGGACVNNCSWHLTNHNLPFGGRGFSGTGAYHGQFSFDTFSHRKGVMKTPTWFDPGIKYPPLKGRLSLFKKLIR